MSEKKIDEGWKRQVQSEKEKFTLNSNTDFPVSQQLESAVFLSLIQSLLVQIDSALQQGSMEDVRKTALMFYILDYKTKDTQSDNEKSTISQFKMDLNSAGLTLDRVLHQADPRVTE